MVERAKIEVEHEDGPPTKPWTNKSIQYSPRENRKRGIDDCFWFRQFLSVTHWKHCECFNSHQIPTFLMCRFLLFSAFFFKKKKNLNYVRKDTRVTLETLFIKLFLEHSSSHSSTHSHIHIDTSIMSTYLYQICFTLSERNTFHLDNQHFVCWNTDSNMLGSNVKGVLSVPKSICWLRWWSCHYKLEQEQLIKLAVISGFSCKGTLACVCINLLHWVQLWGTLMN